MHNNDPASREFTLRGLVLGALMTLVFTAANVYLGLKVGMTFASSIPAAVISMALLYRFRHSNILENNLVQTQASAAGTLPAVIFALPGLLMLGLWTGVPFWQTALICAAGGTLGVLYTVPLRRVMVVQSTLIYPEGVAAAQVLRAGERRAGSSPPADDGEPRPTLRPGAGDHSLRDMGWAAGLAALFGLLSNGLRLLSEGVNVWIPAGGVALRLSLGFSPALLAAGYLMGMAGGLALLAGLALCWGVAVPWLTAHAVPAAGQAISELANQLWSAKVRFMGAGVIAIAALWTVAALAGPIVKEIRRAGNGGPRDDSLTRQTAGDDGTDRDMPRKWILLIGAAALALLFFAVHAFAGDHMPQLGAAARAALSALCVLLAALIGFLVAAACGYMAGLVGSSASPISGVGIIATVLMALALLGLSAAAPGMASSLAGQLGVGLALFVTSAVLAMAAISNDNLQDLKTGHLIGATPWRQQAVLIAGCVTGAAVIAPVVDLLYNAYGFAGALPRADMDPAQALAAPQATLMRQIAGGIMDGSMDWSMLGLGVAAGAAVIAVDFALRRSGRGALPPLAVGLGIYLPPAISMTLALGALLGHAIKRPERAMLLACGLIVGDSLMGLLIAALIGLSGASTPLAVVSDTFALAPWLGLLGFAGLCAFFCKRALAKGGPYPPLPRA